MHGCYRYSGEGGARKWKKSPALKKDDALKKKILVESYSSESDEIDENITKDSFTEWDEFEHEEDKDINNHLVEIMLLEYNANIGLNLKFVF